MYFQNKYNQHIKLLKKLRKNARMVLPVLRNKASTRIRYSLQLQITSEPYWLAITTL